MLSRRAELKRLQVRILLHSPKLAEEAPQLAVGRNRLVFVQQSIEALFLKNGWYLYDWMFLIQCVTKSLARLTAGSSFVKEQSP
jgi:hypothetical protein